MNKENILINIENADEAELALKKAISNPVEVELWGESKSGKHILAVYGASYVVFEKSPRDFVGEMPVYRYVGSESMGNEDGNFVVYGISWREDGGCVRILFHNLFEFNVRTSVTVVFDKEAYDLSERKFRTKNDDPKFLKRKKLVRSYLGKTVDVFMDRPLGYVHKKEKYTITYPVNYGFIPDVIGGDGEELDVYLLGVGEPVSRCTAKIIGIVHRENDIEDKLVAAPEGMSFTKEEIAEQVSFQEKYYDSFIETEESFFECSMKESFLDRKIPAELEHYLLNKLVCHCENENFRFPSWKEFDGLDEFKPYRDKPDEYYDLVSCRPEFICSPRMLYMALWRRYLRMNPKIEDGVKINLRFYFRRGYLMMKVESLE